MTENHKITALVVDDEPDAVSFLEQLLKEFCPQVQVAGAAHSMDTAQEFISNQEFDILFLDIMLAGHTGFDLLKKFPQKKFEVIFTSAHDNFAVKAFRYAAFDYLLKPLDPEELQEAVLRYEQTRWNPDNRFDRLELLLEHLKEQPTSLSKRIALHSSKGFRLVATSEIIYCQSEGNYTHVILKDSTRFLASRSLKEFDQLLTPHGFFRTHQSYLINLQYVKQYHRHRVQPIELVDGSRVELARSKKQPLMQVLSL